MGDIAVGASVPQRGNWLTKRLGKLVLRLLGWTMEGSIPDEPKMVAIGVPHTSNWDFVVAMATMFAVGVRLSWMGKHSLFAGPVGGVMRWLGGLAIDRRAPQGSVAQVIEVFNRSDRLIVGITPEGTRKAVPTWKTGFYRIAAGAGVPILPIALDWQRKVVSFWELVYPSGDMEAEIEAIKDRLRSVQGKYPHGF